MRRAVLALLLLAPAACGGLEVRDDYDPAYDFGALATYSWLDREPPATPEEYEAQLGDPPAIDSLTAQRVRRAAEEGLAARGLRVAESGGDVLLSWAISVEEGLEVRSTTYHYGHGYGYGRYGVGGVGMTDTTVRQVQRGYLVLDLVDPARMEVVWRGSARLDLSPGGTPEKREAAVRETVAAILERYPPAARP